MSSTTQLVPPHFDQFGHPAQWERVTYLAAELPSISGTDFKKRGGNPTESNLLGFIHAQTGEFRIPAFQLEEDGFTIQPEVQRMMDLMHRRGVNAIQIAIWWFEPKDQFNGISPAAHLEITNNRIRILTSTMFSTGPKFWTVSS